MNLYIIPLAYPSKENPTANIFTYEQVKVLASLNNNITILYVQMVPTKKLFTRIDSNIQHSFDGLTERYTIKMKTFKESWFTLIHSWIYLNKLKKLFEYVYKEKGAPDAVYGHFSCFAGWAITRLNKNKNVAIIVQEHDGSFIKKRPSFYRIKLLKETVENSDKFICVSDNLRKKVIEYTKTKKKIIVIPNMIDNQFKFYPNLIDSENFIFSSIGNLYKGKCFNILIEAFCKTFSKDEKVFLRISGDGEKRNQLIKQIHKMGREHQIFLLGRKNRGEILNEYINCNAFVLASDHETFGIVYREAMAVGRPIITTNHGGFGKDEWSDAFGKMVKINDVEGLSKALYDMYNNYSDYKLEEISASCLNIYKSDIIAERINCIIESQVKKKHLYIIHNGGKFD